MKRMIIADNGIRQLRDEINKGFDELRQCINSHFVIGKYDIITRTRIIQNNINSEITSMANIEEKPDSDDRETKKKECEHKWRDYNWYLEYKGKQFPNGNKTFNYTIYEPYVCIYCHKRNTVELENGTIDIRNKTMNDAVRELYQKYPKIKSRALIEDEINDDIYVDREYLKWADFLSGRNEKLEKDGQIKLKLRINEETEANDVVVEGEDGREENNGEAVQGA